VVEEAVEAVATPAKTTDRAKAQIASFIVSNHPEINLVRKMPSHM
jgi:hypothetical protein